MIELVNHSKEVANLHEDAINKASAAELRFMKASSEAIRKIHEVVESLMDKGEFVKPACETLLTAAESLQAERAKTCQHILCPTLGEKPGAIRVVQLGRSWGVAEPGKDYCDHLFPTRGEAITSAAFLGKQPKR